MQEQEEEKGSRHIEQPHALEGDTANGTPETRNHTEPISSSVATDLGVENYSEVEAADSECDQHISDEEVEREELDQRNDHLIYEKPYTGRSLSKEILYHHVRSGTSQSNCSEEEVEPLEQQHYLAKYGINFEDFTFNPCTLPNSKHCSNGGNSSAGFDRWLKTSPYRIWITKHWVERPYGQCKYPHCGKIFLFEKHPTSSNIVKHYKANHKKDWEKFNAKVTKRKQKTLVSMKNVSHSEINPFRLTKNTVDFLSQNEGMIKLLNMFISSLLPFKLVEDSAFRELALLENGCVKKGYTICQKTLVNSMESYHQILEEEMQNILEKTSQINLLLDIWTSVNGKSYLAIPASFCPNLNVAENSTFSKSAANQRNPNTHIIAFHDISHERHTAAYLKEIIIRTLADKKLQRKVASVTFDNATNNVKMMEMIDTDLTGEGVNEVGGIVKIQCFNHILNLIFKKIMRHFGGENQMLVSRIDVLSTKMKNNIFLRTQFQQYTKKILPVHCDTGFVSRYKQFNACLRVTECLREFYFETHMYREYGFEKEDEKAFLYEQSELDPLKGFLKLAQILYDLTLTCQEDSSNGLPYGIQYYMTLKRYFDGCEFLKNGSEEIEHFSDVGVDKKVFYGASQEARLGALSSIIEARPLFEKYYNYAMEQTGYWVAHVLQPDMKLASLNYMLDPQTKAAIERKVYSYIESYFEKCEKRGIGSLRRNNPHPSVSTQKVRKHVKKLKPLDFFKNSIRSAEISIAHTELFEFDQFNREPVETDVDYTKYWLDNQLRYPKLSRLALSLYNSKLSTADVERCFSISKKALTGRYCLTNENLKRSMILRNRLICFGIRRNFTNHNFFASAIVSEATEEE